MKKLLTILVLLMPLLALAQPKILLMSHVEGTNKHTHSNIDAIATYITNYLYNDKGICLGDVSFAGNALSNTLWPDYEQSGSDWCIVINISSSGSGFADEQAEEDWWYNLPSDVEIYNIHSTCGDANRNSDSIQGAPPTRSFWSNRFSLASLPNNQKHSWPSNEDDAFLTTTGVLRFPNMTPVWIDVRDELYWLSDIHHEDNNSYWNRTKIGIHGNYVSILARADENGPFPSGHQVPVIWELWNDSLQHVVNMSYGHGSEIHTDGEPQSEMLKGIIDYLLDEATSNGKTCSCLGGSPFNIREDSLLQEPTFYEPGRVYHWYTIDGRDLGESEYPPLSNTLLIRKAYGVKPKLILMRE